MRQEPTFSTLDQRMMARALALARRGEGRVEPNPMVGCVIARGDMVLGEGFHRKFGGRHAEIEALRGCASGARGAAAYLSLEPCAHHGKTPPCVDALIAAEVGRVVIPFVDPNPEIRGKGVERLRGAGIRVDVGLMRDEAAALIAPFATYTVRERPYVIAKWAQTADGKWATRSGDSKWISGEASRRFVHRMRGRVDVIMVGGRTVETDDPMLTARHVPRRRVAMRAVIDTRLHAGDERQLFEKTDAGPVLVFTSRQEADGEKANRLRGRGVEVIGVDSTDAGLAVPDVLKHLHSRDCTNVLVEGGPALTGSFLRARLVDEAYVFIAPKLLGDADAHGLNFSGVVEKMEDVRRLAVSEVRRFDDDVCLRLRLNDPPWPV